MTQFGFPHFPRQLIRLGIRWAISVELSQRFTQPGRGELSNINQGIAKLERLALEERKRSLEAKKELLSERLRAHGTEKPEQRDPPDVTKDPDLDPIRQRIRNLRTEREGLELAQKGELAKGCRIYREAPKKPLS